MEFSKEELRILHQALNEILNGPEAIEEWEFHARMGTTREEAQKLMDKLREMHGSSIKKLYERLKNLPVSNLAKQDIGGFMLYDSLLAGCASRAGNGEVISKSEIPEPGEELTTQISTLRQKNDLTSGERAYLEHFDLLEEIRSVLNL